METAGYSGTPLSRKLGFKSGFNIRLINEPDYYFKLFPNLLTDLVILEDPGIKKDIIHYFTKEISELERDILLLKVEIEQNGSIWISWPKKSSKVATNVTEDLIRNLALTSGLVDVKVCAVDEIWSALKLVIPVKDRL